MRRIRSLIPLTIITVACGFTVSALADDDDYPVWKPSNDPAISVTGPIILVPAGLKAGLVHLSWQAQGVVPQFKPDQGPIPARVFELGEATSPELLNGKKLCGDKAVNWIVMIPAPPDGLEIDAYSAADKPTSIGSPGLCGSFSYKRW